MRIVAKESETDEKYKSETLPNDIKVGDAVKWKVMLIENWSGIYLGTKDGKAVVRTTEKGRTIFKELDYNKAKLSKI